MKIVRTKSDLRALTKSWRAAGETIGIVPTMGALHAGHMSLVNAAQDRADRVIVTLFVNPKQFNNPEDLKKYPRTEDSDAAKLAPLGIDVLYVPDGDQMYPEGFSTAIIVSGISEGLCGATRPGHFDGVATVVAKLLLQTDADFAFFGEKDFQQLQVVRRLVIDLDLGAEIVGCPTIREADGLALSSRNVRLGADARGKAPVIHEALKRAAGDIRTGADPDEVLAATRQRLEDAGLGPVDYLEYRRDADLSPVSGPAGDERRDSRQGGRLYVAAWLDGVRLIDNLPVPAVETETV